jgi:hypothetical protein
MNAKTRRTVEMAARALTFSREHPDPSAGYIAALGRLEERYARATELAARQLAGVTEVRAASARKYEIRRTLRQLHLAHIMGVARIAGHDVPGLADRFVVVPETAPYLTFRTSARSAEAAAIEHRELLVRYGLSERALDALTSLLDEFDVAAARVTEGRLEHVGASAELARVAANLTAIVSVMDGFNRIRFEGEPDQLAAWRSASSVVATPHPAAKPSGDVSAAA